MKLLLLVLLLIYLGLAYAGEFSSYYKDPDHPGKCFYAGLVLSPGEQGQPVGKCQRFLCKRSDGFGTVEGCAAQNVKPACHVEEHIKPNGPYPDCCMRKVVCP